MLSVFDIFRLGIGPSSSHTVGPIRIAKRFVDSLDRDGVLPNTAEIGMEHNLGLTCDPIGGLVQIPCIERNAIGAWKAVNAARLALHASDQMKANLDQVIETMLQTGIGMSSKYKETSQGGLAVNVVEC